MKQREEVKKEMKKTLICVTALATLLILSFISTILIQPASAHNRQTQAPDLVPVVNPDYIWNLPGGKWDAWTCDGGSDTIVILLFGGHAYTNKVLIDAFTNWQEYYFVLALHAKGVDVVTPRFESGNTFWYDASSPSGNEWLSYTGMVLKAFYDYDHVYLFGHSAGGVAVGYEIQKSYAGQIFDGAVMAMCPVDWANHPGEPLFHTAQTAQNTKIRTSFIACQQDAFYTQMVTYRDNMVIAKDWHKWAAGVDPHDPFPDTCLDHGENVEDVVYNWILYPTYQLYVQAVNPMGQPLQLPLYIDDQYVGTTCNSYQVKLGYHKIYIASAGFIAYGYPPNLDYNNPIYAEIVSNTFINAWCYY